MKEFSLQKTKNRKSRDTLSFTGSKPTFKGFAYSIWRCYKISTYIFMSKMLHVIANPIQKSFLSIHEKIPINAYLEASDDKKGLMEKALYGDHR